MIKRSTNVPMSVRVRDFKKLKHALSTEEHVGITGLSKKYIRSTFIEMVLKDKKIIERRKDGLWYFDEEFKINKKSVKDICELSSELCKKIKISRKKAKETKPKVKQTTQEEAGTTEVTPRPYNNSDVANMIEEFAGQVRQDRTEILSAIAESNESVNSIKVNLYDLNQTLNKLIDRNAASDEIHLSLVKKVKDVESIVEKLKVA